MVKRMGSLHDDQRRPERDESLWRLIYGPVIWLLHFLLSYITTAVWCARAGGSLDSVRMLMGIYTLLALVAVGLIMRRGLRCAGSGTILTMLPPHDAPTAMDRRRFIEFTTALLCGLSIVAILYVALTPVFIGHCA